VSIRDEQEEQEHLRQEWREWREEFIEKLKQCEAWVWQNPPERGHFLYWRRGCEISVADLSAAAMRLSEGWGWLYINEADLPHVAALRRPYVIAARKNGVAKIRWDDKPPAVPPRPKRPKATKAQRDARRKAAAAEDARIAVWREKLKQRERLGTAVLMCGEEAMVRVLGGHQLPADGAYGAPPVSPATEFIFQRVRKAPAEQLGATYKRAVAELMASDTPMTAREHRRWTDALQSLKSKRRPEAVSPRAKAHVYNELIDHLVARGDTVEEAKEKVADEFGLGSAKAVEEVLRRHGRK
jgi:hypothetical protein